MRLSLLPVLMFGIISAYGQKGQPLDTVTVSHDIFKGELGANPVTIVLQLDHKRYADEGNFIWEELSAGTAAKIVSGEWTVVEGDAHDEYATVVELDPPGGTLYFLRKKDGRLQQLDSLLEEIKPAAAYTLRKDNRQSPVTIPADAALTAVVQEQPATETPPQRQAPPKQPKITKAAVAEKKPVAQPVPAADTAAAEDAADGAATETTSADTVAATEVAIEKTGKKDEAPPAAAEAISRADSAVWQVEAGKWHL